MKLPTTPASITEMHDDHVNIFCCVWHVVYKQRGVKVHTEFLQTMLQEMKDDNNSINSRVRIG